MAPLFYVLGAIVLQSAACIRRASSRVESVPFKNHQAVMMEMMMETPSDTVFLGEITSRNPEIILASVSSTSMDISVRQEEMHEQKRAYLIRSVFTAIACLALSFLYGHTHHILDAKVGLKLTHVCCLVYATLSITIDLSIKVAAEKHGGKFPFEPGCAVVVVEYGKMLVSIVLFAAHAFRSRQNGEEIVLPGFRDVAWLTVPASMYAINNLIVFQAIRSTPLATFGVLRETMLIWNALIWTVTFRQRISMTRWVAILGIFVGCTLNQVPALVGSRFSYGIFWALLLAFMNAASAVANEYAMKKRAALDINMQNIILYSLCGSFVLIVLTIVKPATVQSPEAFFTGFVPECWQIIILQMFTGLAVSRILKYVEAVTKTIVAALRGPGVIFIGAAILHVRLGIHEVAATAVVCVSCWTYLREGPLVRSAQPADQKTAGGAKALTT